MANYQISEKVIAQVKKDWLNFKNRCIALTNAYEKKFKQQLETEKIEIANDGHYSNEFIEQWASEKQEKLANWKETTISDINVRYNKGLKLLDNLASHIFTEKDKYKQYVINFYTGEIENYKTDKNDFDVEFEGFIFKINDYEIAFNTIKSQFEPIINKQEYKKLTDTFISELAFQWSKFERESISAINYETERCKEICEKIANNQINESKYDETEIYEALAQSKMGINNWSTSQLSDLHNIYNNGCTIIKKLQNRKFTTADNNKTYTVDLLNGKVKQSNNVIGECNLEINNFAITFNDTTVEFNSPEIQFTTYYETTEQTPTSD